MSSSESVVEVLVETAALAFSQPVRAEDSLFDLGADSLSVIDFCRKLEQKLGVEIEVEDLFAAESFASFGAALAPRVALGKRP